MSGLFTDYCGLIRHGLLSNRNDRHIRVYFAWYLCNQSDGCNGHSSEERHHLWVLHPISYSKNTEVVGSEKWVDAMIAKGCKFGWYFTYIPIEKDACPNF